MGDFETKTLSGFEIKNVDRGEVTAVVSVFNVVDRDGDVILPGAITDGTVVNLSAYGHDIITEGKPPVGRGVLRVDGKRAVLDGHYFMSTQRGREAFAQVKDMGTGSEWSIGYFRSRVKTTPMTKEWKDKGASRIMAHVPVFESSPVFMGANQFTSTLGVKSAVDSQADGVVEDEMVKEVVAEITARREAAQLEAKRIRDEVETKAAEEREAARVTAEQAATAEAARIEAETKATADADAARIAAEEAARVAAETKAADAVYQRFLRISDEHAPTPAREYERFQKTMQRHKVG